MILGAVHMDELVYLFSMKLLEKFNLNPMSSSENQKVMERMVELWTTFAKTGYVN